MTSSRFINMRSLSAMVVCAGLSFTPHVSLAAKSKGGPPPDYTAGQAHNEAMTPWSLGAIGALGYIHNANAEQILIHEV